MNLSEERQFKYKPWWLIVVGLIVIAVVSNLFQSNYNTGVLEEVKRRHLENIREREEKHAQDSIKYANIDVQLQRNEEVKDSLRAKIKYFKNRAYVNYKNYINEANTNYSSSDDDAKNGIFTDLIDGK